MSSTPIQEASPAPRQRRTAPAAASASLPSAVVDTSWRSLTTREGWADFCRREASTRPDVLDAKPLRALSDSARAEYDRRRHLHHANFGPFLTPALTAAMDDVIDLVEDNSLSTQATAKPGAVLDGFGGLGKTTILTAIGRQVERDARAGVGWDVRTSLGAAYVPVVYLTLTEGITIKQVNEALAGFYGASVPARASKEQIGSIVVQCAERCGTRLILVDDIHNLRLKDPAGRMVNSHLKHLANVVPVTFVYAGIDTASSGLLAEGLSSDKVAASQTRRRFTPHEVKPFDVTEPAGRQAWLSLVASIEDELALANAEPGMLTSDAQYLHQRTQGFIGPLTSLVRRAARRAIRDGSENITRQALERITLDAASEAERPARPVGRPTRRGLNA